MRNIPILDAIADWFRRSFADPEAVTLFLFLVALLFLVEFFGATLEPIILSIVLAYLLDPIVRMLERWRLPHWLSVTIVFVAFLSAVIMILVGLVPLLWRQITSLGHEIPLIVQKTQQYISVVAQKHPGLLSQSQLANAEAMIRTQAAHVGKLIFSYSLSSLSVGVSIILYLILVPTIIFFILKDRDSLLNWFQGYMPGHRTLIKRVWGEVHLQIASYVRGRVIEVIIMGLASAFLFSVLGLNYTAILAVASGLAVIVPYVGAVLVIIPLVIVGLIQWGAGLHFAYLMSIYAVLLVLDAYVLVPKLFSGMLNLSPVVIIISIIIFGAIWGFWGVFLAIPLAALIKTVLDAWPRSKGSAADSC